MSEISQHGQQNIPGCCAKITDIKNRVVYDLGRSYLHAIGQFSGIRSPVFACHVAHRR